MTTHDALEIVEKESAGLIGRREEEKSACAQARKRRGRKKKNSACARRVLQKRMPRYAHGLRSRSVKKVV